jgi:hypothetical protein
LLAASGFASVAVTTGFAGAALGAAVLRALVAVVSALLAIFMHHFCFVAVHNNESGGEVNGILCSAQKIKSAFYSGLWEKLSPEMVAGDSLGDACFMRLRR